MELVHTKDMDGTLDAEVMQLAVYLEEQQIVLEERQGETHTHRKRERRNE